MQSVLLGFLRIVACTSEEWLPNSRHDIRMNHCKYSQIEGMKKTKYPGVTSVSMFRRFNDSAHIELESGIFPLIRRGHVTFAATIFFANSVKS